MNLLVGQITLVLVLVILFLPRRWAVLGVVSGIIYVTQSKFLSVSGIDFTAIRFIILFGFIRVAIVRKEFSFSNLNSIDRSFLLFSSVYFLVFALRSQLNPGAQSFLMYRLGQFCDGLLSYFTFRGLLKDPDSFRQFLRDMALLILPFTILIVLESITGRNFFSIMGGVRETPIIRDGSYRSTASFRHAITAGSFGATLMPLFVYMALFTSNRFRTVIGIILCILIVIASHSSGPLMAFIFGITAWMCWPMRERMRTGRWAIIGFLVSLHIAMKAPVWFVYARLSDIVGGDGWHRANLIDKFIHGYQEWWLIGMPIENTLNWAATRMPWGGVDVTSEYIKVGINGGLISLLLFIWLLRNCFKSIGNAMKKIRIDTQGDIQNEALLWGLGSALFSHAMNLTAVTYFDQFWVMWYMLLAVIAGVTQHYLLGDERLSLETTQPEQSIPTAIN